MWRVMVLMWDMESSSDLLPRLHVKQKIDELTEENNTFREDLAECRRTYLKELTALRDQLRSLEDEQVLQIRNLVYEEQPIMFYEPVKYLKDEGLKDFIGEVVEEKMKVLYSCRSEDSIAPPRVPVWVSYGIYTSIPVCILDTLGIPYGRQTSARPGTYPHTIPYPIPSGGYDTLPIPEYTYHTTGQADRDPPASHTLIPYHTPIPSAIVSPRMYTVVLYHDTAGAISTDLSNLAFHTPTLKLSQPRREGSRATAPAPPLFHTLVRLRGSAVRGYVSIASNLRRVCFAWRSGHGNSLDKNQHHTESTEEERDRGKSARWGRRR